MADGLARSAPGLDEVTRTLVTELSLVSGEAGRREEHVRLLLETTRPDWLRMYLADSLLRNYDYAVVPDEKKHLLHRPPSLEKIVSFVLAWHVWILIRSHFRYKFGLVDKSVGC